MIQQFFNGILTLMLAKFVLNDIPHLLLEANPYILETADKKVKFREYLSEVVEEAKIGRLDLEDVFDNMKITRPRLARLLELYYYIACQMATPWEAEEARRAAYRETLTLLDKYRLYIGLTGKDFENIVQYLSKTKLELLAADTRQEKGIAVDMFIGSVHAMIVDRWEGEMLGGGVYPVAFDMTDQQAGFVRVFAERLFR